MPEYLRVLPFVLFLSLIACSKQPKPVTASPSSSYRSSPASTMTAPPTASATTPAPPQRVTVVRMETVAHSQKLPSVHIEYPRLILSDSKATAALEAAVRAKIIPETVGDDESMGP